MTTSHAGVSYPISRGRVTDVPGTARMLCRLLLGRADRAPRPELIVVTIPVLCPEADRHGVIAAVEILEPRTVITIDGVKAAAIGATTDLARPLLVIDLGAQLTEVAVLADGSVVEARRTPHGTADLRTSMTVDNLVEDIRDMVADLLSHDCGPQVVDALDRGPLLAGGGALLPAITYQLSKQLSCMAQPAPAPYTVALRGASTVALAARRHPGIS
ncbi:rod shape-determining protein [Kribbella sp. NPDC026596]|uniref:rod shape-determining protein n=1 Tax=Kribbella sp. NPDC026596 TaxID=3155122 RepID=UPI0033C9133E